MTSEQVANMREAAGYGVWAGEVMQLLDEREALVEALRKATDAIAAEWGESSAQELRHVITKAEAP